VKSAGQSASRPPGRSDARFPAARILPVVLGLAVMLVTLVVPAGCGDSPTAPDQEAGQSPLQQCLARAVFGDPANSQYILPFPVGASYPLLQTYCGPQNHGNGNQLAWDFTVPFGDPVIASRAGTVRVVVDTYADDDQIGSHNNHIFIEHADGTTALYAHLVRDSATVHVGDGVAQGQLIALSGTSGAPVEVLHFAVYRTWPNREGDDVPVSFRNADGPLDERGGLVQGATYTALPW